MTPVFLFFPILELKNVTGCVALNCWSLSLKNCCTDDLPVQTKCITNIFTSWATGGYGCCSQIGKPVLSDSQPPTSPYVQPLHHLVAAEIPLLSISNTFLVRLPNSIGLVICGLAMRLAVASLLLQSGGVHIVWKVGKYSQQGDSPE